MIKVPRQFIVSVTVLCIAVTSIFLYARSISSKPDIRAQHLAAFIASPLKMKFRDTDAQWVRDLILAGRQLTRQPTLEVEHIQQLQLSLQQLFLEKYPDKYSDLEPDKLARRQHAMASLLSAGLSDRLRLDAKVSMEAKIAAAALFRWMMMHPENEVRVEGLVCLGNSRLCFIPKYRAWLDEFKTDANAEVASMARLQIMHNDAAIASAAARGR